MDSATYLEQPRAHGKFQEKGIVIFLSKLIIIQTRAKGNQEETV